MRVGEREGGGVQYAYNSTRARVRGEQRCVSTNGRWGEKKKRSGTQFDGNVLTLCLSDDISVTRDGGKKLPPKKNKKKLKRKTQQKKTKKKSPYNNHE